MMSDTLENRLRGIYEVGYNAEFGHRDFSKHVPAINIEAADEIANLKAQMPQWVSVDDKLPPIGETVLWFYCGKDSDKKVTLHRMDISAKKFALTKAYWMPLPPAPTA